MSVVPPPSHPQPRHHDSAARRLTTAETIVVGVGRPKTDAPTPVSAGVPQMGGAPDSPWAVIRIERPGTYRLAADVLAGDSTIGILIAADHVTLDLAGFSVIGRAGSLSGIRVIGGRTNVCVRNGSVRCCGGHGVDLSDATESHVASLRVTENSGDGLRIGANSIADDIVVWSNSRDGLVTGSGSSVRGCTARANAGVGIALGDASIAQDCTAMGNQRHGVMAGVAAIVRECVARHNHGAGIVVGNMGSVRDCDLIQNDVGGVRAGAQVVVVENRCIAPGGESPISAGPGSLIRDNLDGSTMRAA